MRCICHAQPVYNTEGEMCLESIPLHQSTLYECRFLTCWSNVCCLLAVAPVRDKSATRKMSRPNREVTSQLSETSNVAAKHLRLVCEALSHQSSLSLCKLHASPQNVAAKQRGRLSETSYVAAKHLRLDPVEEDEHPVPERHLQQR